MRREQPLDISFADGAEEIGLASMLAELIRQNVEQRPHKKADFDRLDRVVSIEAKDAEVTITLEFKRGALVVHGGVFGKPDIGIVTDSETVLELSTGTLFFGMPNLLDAAGRRMLKKTASGALKITGLPGNLIQLV